MHYNALLRLLASGTDKAASRYAIVDCATTAGFMDADEIYDKLSHPDIEKYCLFTGENAWAIDHVAPHLIPLDSQPELEQWLVQNGWGKGWAVFFTSEADIDALVAHFRTYLELKADNGRNVLFRFYDPLILGDLLSILDDQESLAFFGPVRRFVMENPQGEPVMFEKPAGRLTTDIDPSRLILGADKKALFSKQWRQRLMDGHIQAYRELGFDVTADSETDSITLEDKAGANVQLQKTIQGVDVITGENRRFQYELTSCKHPAGVTDPAGHRIDFDVAERDNKEKRNTIPILYGIRTGGGKNWVFDYDEYHHLEGIHYPDGTHAAVSHDSYGNLTGFTDRTGHRTVYEYDFDQRLTRITDANEQQTRFDYDDLTAPSKISFADGTAFDFTYTDAGALEKFLADNALVADYQVDRENDQWKVTYTDGGWAEFKMKNGRIVSAANPAGTVELEYDDNGHLIGETFGNRTVTYHRNPTGQLAGITTAFGQTIQYQRDKENRVTRINWAGKSIKIQYGLNGALKKIEYPNKTRLHHRTNDDGLPVEITLDAPGGPVFYKTYQRDIVNRVTRINDQINDRINDRDQHVDYIYDPEGRLLETRSDNDLFNEHFRLDAKANRLADQRTRYRVNPADRLEQAGPTAFAYDALGNLNQGACPRGPAEFTFADLNRLKAINLNNQRIQYQYDAFGRRVSKTVNGTTTRFYWAGSQLLHEAQIYPVDPQTTVTDYLFFPQTPVLLAIRHNQQTCWAAFGHRYEVLSLTDNQGQPVWHAQYDAFGNAHIRQGADVHQPFRLAGQYYDPESGLHYNQARYYDPKLGRYLSPDPLFLEGGSTNFYAYCNGDPINHIDPDGEFIFCAILIGAAIGAAIGAGVEYMHQKSAGEEVDGFKIAKAALIGGAIGAIGGGVGAAIEAAAAAGMAGSALAASTLPAMATVGFVSGAGSSVAEQCAEAKMTGAGIAPLDVAKQALTDGLIGGGVSLVTFGTGGFLARKLRKAGTKIAANLPTERAATLVRKAKGKVRQLASKTKSAGAGKSGQSNKFCVGDPVNPMTGEVVLDQSDFTLPGRIPIVWSRRYGSRCDYTGLLGRGWQTPADARLEIDSDGLVTFYDGNPKAAVFESLPDQQPVMEVADGAMLSATQDHYQVRQKSGLIYHFAKTITGNQTHVVRISDPGGNAISFDRRDGRLIGITDSSGQHLDIICDQGRIVTIKHLDKTLITYRYDQQGRLIAAADPLGHPKRFYYENDRLARHTDKNDLSFYYEYDDSGRCVHTWGDNGLYDYRLDHRPYERRVAVTDSLGQTTIYAFNQDGLPVKEQDPTGAVIAYEYDDLGRVISVTDPLERVTEYEYDPAGNLLDIIRPDHHNMTLVYDDNHRPVQMLDANGKIWEQRFDEHGRLVEKISPLEDVRTLYTYNSQGDLESVTDPQGIETAFEYDRQGLVKSVTIAGRTSRYKRDPLGNITAVIDPAGRTTRYVYDDKSRLVQTELSSGRNQQFEWDPEDNLLLHTDPSGRQTRFEYGGVNEIVKRINPDGTTVTYQYDTEENLIGLTNEKGQPYRFSYDPAGRISAQTDYYGHTTRYTYDPAGQLIQSTDPLRRTIAYDYDPAGRLISKTFENQEQEQFSWDAVGNLTGFQSPDAAVERIFDAANHLITEKTGEFTVEYQYDRKGRRTRRTTSHGNTVSYTYDDLDAVTAIRINDQPPVTIQRDQLGRITSEQFSEHLQRTTSYTEDGLPAGQTIDSATGRIHRRYEYDPAGNLLARHDNHKGPWRFTYDPMGRITEALSPEHQVQKFTYDPAGDLFEHLPGTDHGLRTTRYHQTEYQYDAAGNLVQRRQGDQLARFTWDENNRLKTVRKTDDTRITMGYDALGRRHTKAVNGQRTFFTWDSDALLSEQFEDGPVREYVYYPGTFEPLALIDGDGSVHYYHNDVNGLPQELTRYNGEIVWSATYDALGRVEKILVDEVAQPLRMQGQYFDIETGLCYNRNRYFDPQTCSFISQDPIGLAGGENVYAYAPNVWSWVDPLGLCKEQANVHVAYRKNKPVGHNLIGIELPNAETRWFDLVMTEDPGGLKGLVKGGQGTILREQSKISRNNLISTRTVDLDSAKAMLEKAEALMASDTGGYNILTNSCTSTVSDILKAGGTKPAWWAKTPSLIKKWF